MSETLYEDHDTLVIVQFVGPDRGDGSDRRRIQLTTNHEQITFTIDQWNALVKAARKVKIRGKETQAVKGTNGDATSS